MANQHRRTASSVYRGAREWRDESLLQHQRAADLLCLVRRHGAVGEGGVCDRRVHGLKSGKTLKVLRGHGSYVNSAVFTVDQQRVLSASSDGFVKLWDLATSSCVRTIQPARTTDSFAEIQLVSALPLVQNPEWLLVIARLDKAFVVTTGGNLVFTLHADEEKVQFVAGCESPHVGEECGHES